MPRHIHAQQVAAQVKPKLKQTPTGVFVGTITASGEAEIGIDAKQEHGAIDPSALHVLRERIRCLAP